MTWHGSLAGLLWVDSVFSFGIDIDTGVSGKQGDEGDDTGLLRIEADAPLANAPFLNFSI